LKISDIGPPGTLRDLVPGVMNLYLDKNLLYSWDQFFQITSELRYLRVLALTGNKFRKIDKSYFDGKNIDQLVHTHLHELVLIDMSLDWSQLDILAPTLLYVEKLFLVRNNCSKICSQYEIDKQYWKNLRYLNLEQNGIESWDEIAGFRKLNDFTHLIVNKNRIREIYHKPGFRGLKYLSFEDNLISTWKSFDQLDEFDSRIEQIRCQGNPIMNEEGKDVKRARQIAIGRLEFLKKYNGTRIEPDERKDIELFYLKVAYETYLRDILKVKDQKDVKVESLEDPGLVAYVQEFHPRFWQLVGIYGSPLAWVNVKFKTTNIASTSAKMELISHIPETEGKVLSKKLLLSMTVTQLKSMCSKLFKGDILKLSLEYRGLEDTQDYPLDEDFRQLSFYSMDDGGKIMVK